MTPEQEARIQAVLEATFRGLHHCLKIHKFSHWWEVNTSGGSSTYDGDLLTRLVFASHDQCVRAEIKSSGPVMIKIVLHPRRARSGSFFERHPTIEMALTKWRELGYKNFEEEKMEEGE